MTEQETKDLLKLNGLEYNDFIEWFNKPGNRVRSEGKFFTYDVWKYIREKNDKYLALD